MDESDEELELFKELPLELRSRIAGFKPELGKNVSREARRTAVPILQRRGCERDITREEIKKVLRSGNRTGIIGNYRPGIDQIYGYIVMGGDDIEFSTKIDYEFEKSLTPRRRQHPRIIGLKAITITLHSGYDLLQSGSYNHIDILTEFEIRNSRKACDIDDTIAKAILVKRYNEMFSEERIDNVFADLATPEPTVYKHFFYDLVINAMIIGNIHFDSDSEVFRITPDNLDQIDNDITELILSIKHGIQRLTGAFNDSMSPFKLVL